MCSKYCYLLLSPFLYIAHNHFLPFFWFSHWVVFLRSMWTHSIGTRSLDNENGGWNIFSECVVDVDISSNHQQQRLLFLFEWGKMNGIFICKFICSPVRLVNCTALLYYCASMPNLSMYPFVPHLHTHTHSFWTFVKANRIFYLSLFHCYRIVSI